MSITPDHRSLHCPESGESSSSCIQSQEITCGFRRLAMRARISNSRLVHFERPQGEIVVNWRGWPLMNSECGRSHPHFVSFRLFRHIRKAIATEGDLQFLRYEMNWGGLGAWNAPRLVRVVVRNSDVCVFWEVSHQNKLLKSHQKNNHLCMVID
jgi:hypothetical protein